MRLCARIMMCVCIWSALRSEATIRYAMVDLLKHPPPEFKEAIQMHFRCVWGGGGKLPAGDM
jgi:hypothetical protein